MLHILRLTEPLPGAGKYIAADKDGRRVMAWNLSTRAAGSLPAGWHVLGWETHLNAGGEPVFVFHDCGPQ